MLCCVTDRPPTPWLAYILDEFARIQGADFPVRVLAAGQEPPAGAAVLRYAAAPGTGADPDPLFDCGQCPPWPPVAGPDGVFLPAGAKTPGPGYALPYDPLWAAFAFLSRGGEYEAHTAGHPTRAYASRLPGAPEGFFETPAVNVLFTALEALIRRRFPALPWRDAPGPRLELSHDVDYVRKTIQLRLKQTAMNGYNLLRGTVGIGHAARFLFSNPSYWRFGYWKELEKAHTMVSTFYVYARARPGGPVAWLLDPSYDVARHGRLGAELRGLVQGGFEVGLHGSYASAVDGGLLAREKEVLERVLGTGVRKVRQHWLRYDEDATPAIHEGLFALDSSLGWNDRMGFRAGCASRYRPWLHREQRPCAHMVTPQVLMDSNIFDYGAGRSGELTERAMAMLQGLAAVRNAHVSVSWHQRVCSPDYGWQEPYQRIVQTFGRGA